MSHHVQRSKLTCLETIAATSQEHTRLLSSGLMVHCGTHEMITEVDMACQANTPWSCY